MKLSVAAEGRIIHLSFDVTFIPPDMSNLGHTDAAWEIGKEFVRKAIAMLQNNGEAEGFVVQVEARQVVY